MLVVQDIFLTETGYLADVILPASAFPEKTGTFTNTDRLVQLGRQALDPARRGTPRSRDHRRDGAAARPRLDTTRIRAKCSPRCARRCRRSPGITWERLERESAVTYPCEQEGDAGTRVVFTEDFPTANGRGRFVPAALIPRGGAAGQRLPVRADHRAPTRALAHRQHDATHRRAGRDRAVPGRVAQFGGPGRAWRCARRHDHGRLAPWRDHTGRARGRRHAARRRFHPVLLSTKRRQTSSRTRC